VSLARRPAGGSLLLAAALVLAAGPASAASGLATEGGSGLLDVRTAEGLPAGGVVVQAGAIHYSLDAERVPGSSAAVGVTDGGVQVALGAGGFGEAWIRGRFVREHADTASARIFPGDARAGVKLFTPALWGGLRAGVAADLSLGGGDRDRGGSTGARDPGVAGLLTVPLPLPGEEVRTYLHLNAGYRAHGDDSGRTFEGTPAYYLEPVYPAGRNDRVDLRGALEVRSPSTSLFLELVLDRLVHPGVAWSESPRFFNAGFRTHLLGPVSLRVASRVTLSHDDESTARFRPPEVLYPDWQWGMALAFAHPRGD